MIDERAGELPEADDLVDVNALIAAFYEEVPDAGVTEQKVAFGTSGHRGSSFKRSFNEAHCIAISKAIVEWRKQAGIGGPMYLAFDTHALSMPAFQTSIEVFAASGIEFFFDSELSYTPTPALSHAVIAHNKYAPANKQADGIVFTPSHNPPTDGGYKYNTPNGGPADNSVTNWIQDRANEILASGFKRIKRIPYDQAMKREGARPFAFAFEYISDLPNVIDFDAIRKVDLHLAADALGGAAINYWPQIAEMHNLNIEFIHPEVDPQFAYLTLDWDGKIRMDCSSKYAMAGLAATMDANPGFDLAFGNDGDADRHGIVDEAGLMNPNYFLASAIDFLFKNRKMWPAGAKVGKTIVSSRLIDAVAKGLGRKLVETPVGFKYFSEGLIDSSFGFGGEESAGASFLRMNGDVWTTDKDGPIMCLLAAEILAKTGLTPSQYFKWNVVEEYGESFYKRVDFAASPAQKAKLKNLKRGEVTSKKLAGEAITSVRTSVPATDDPIGGVKVSAKNSWFCARPSGTENVYKVYAESFISDSHLEEVLASAEGLVAKALG